MPAFLNYIYGVLAVAIYAVPFLLCLIAIGALPMAVIYGVTYLSGVLFLEGFPPKDLHHLRSHPTTLALLPGGFVGMFTILFSMAGHSGKVNENWPKIGEEYADLGAFATGRVVLGAAGEIVLETAMLFGAVAVVATVGILVVFGVMWLEKAFWNRRERRAKVAQIDTELEHGVGASKLDDNDGLASEESH